MNTVTNDVDSSHVNTSSADSQRIRSSPSHRWWRVSLSHLQTNGSSKAIPIYKQILKDESTHLLTNDESVTSSVNIGSYMSAVPLSTS